jgi:hypothetical protein
LLNEMTSHQVKWMDQLVDITLKEVKQVDQLADITTQLTSSQVEQAKSMNHKRPSGASQVYESSRGFHCSGSQSNFPCSNKRPTRS